ncbi:GyrI-like domain-containing protein [Bizionia sp. KMM 8389]
MKTIKYILFLLLILIIGASIYIAVQPNGYSMTRTKTIHAPAEVIYNQVVKLESWKSWTSWTANNPSIITTLKDSTAGVGGEISWEGDKKTGLVKTQATTPFKTINQDIQLNEFSPANSLWEFNQISATETEVVWTLSANNLSFYEKGYALLNGGQNSIFGPDFEESLDNLETVVLKVMSEYHIKVDGIAHHGGGYYIYSTTSSKISELQTTIQKLFPRVKDYALKNNIAMAGAPFVSYHKWDTPNNAVLFSYCVPTTTEVITTQSDILTGHLEPFKAVKTTLKGNTSNLQEAWNESRQYINQYNLETIEQGPMLEVYLTDPTTQANPAKWITELYQAIN